MRIGLDLVRPRSFLSPFQFQSPFPFQFPFPFPGLDLDLDLDLDLVLVLALQRRQLQMVRLVLARPFPLLMRYPTVTVVRPGVIGVVLRRRPLLPRARAAPRLGLRHFPVKRLHLVMAFPRHRH
jgi:hypothetical protein